MLLGGSAFYHHATRFGHAVILAGGGQPFRLSSRRSPHLCQFPSAHKANWYFPADYCACVQPITSASLAAYCSASSARAEFLQRVRRLLTGGSLRPVCALGGNRLASSFQDTSAYSSGEGGDSAGGSTGGRRGRTSRTLRLVCSVPAANKRDIVVGLRRRHCVLVKNAATASQPEFRSDIAPPQ